MKLLSTFLTLFLFVSVLNAQHHFKGQIDNDRWQNEVYLSVIEDYRTLDGINEEQIISKATTNASGRFEFRGNYLENTNKIYKLHVDNCSSNGQNSNHFDGHCEDSRDILFIAKDKDTINFPLGFEDQIFCDVRSTNPKTSAFIKIDSLKQIMKFEYGEFRSQANRQLNNKKWFTELQAFGKAQNEPLAELYIYTFLSNRSNNFHSHYLEDLKTNPYYDALLERLKLKYPKSSYFVQYKAELTADKYIVLGNENEEAPLEKNRIPWAFILIIVLLVSISINIYLFLCRKAQKKLLSITVPKANLTAQEQKVLDLLLTDNSNKAIAAALFVSVSTVKTHINSIYKKLNVNSRNEAKSLLNN